MWSRSHHQPMRFFTLSLALTWVPLWFAVIGMRSGWLESWMPFMVMAGLSPAVAALVMVYGSRDAGMVKDYWIRVFEFRRTSRVWWAFILTFPLIIGSAGTLVSMAYGGKFGQFGPSAEFLSGPLAFAAMALIYGPVPEELGWRGYGIDSLRVRVNLVNSSLIMGLHWCLWHLPMAFLPGTFQYGLLVASPVALVFYFAALFPTSFITNWLYYKTSRSTLSAILFHFTTNFYGQAMMVETNTRMLQTAFLFLAAGAIIASDRRFVTDRAISVPSLT